LQNNNFSLLVGFTPYRDVLNRFSSLSSVFPRSHFSPFEKRQTAFSQISLLLLVLIPFLDLAASSLNEKTRGKVRVMESAVSAVDANFCTAHTNGRPRLRESDVVISGSRRRVKCEGGAAAASAAAAASLFALRPPARTGNDTLTPLP